MNVVKRIARTIRGYNTEGSAQAFYGAVATRNRDGGPRYSEAKRDFDALKHANDRYLFY